MSANIKINTFMQNLLYFDITIITASVRWSVAQYNSKLFKLILSRIHLIKFSFKLSYMISAFLPIGVNMNNKNIDINKIVLISIYWA